MWPTDATNKYRYHALSIAVLVLIGIGFPLSQIANLFLVSSVDDMMDHLFISLTIICGTVKSINLYVQRQRFQRIFDVHEELILTGFFDRRVFDGIRSMIAFIFKFFVFMYMSAWVFVGLYNVISVREKRFWPSTHHIQSDWAEGEVLYWSVFAYQAVTNFCFCGWHAMLDTMPIILIIILCGHLDVLQERLGELGVKIVEGEAKTGAFMRRKRRVDKDAEYYKALKKCCIHYELCLR